MIFGREEGTLVRGFVSTFVFELKANLTDIRIWNTGEAGDLYYYQASLGAIHKLLNTLKRVTLALGQGIVVGA